MRYVSTSDHLRLCVADIAVPQATDGVNSDTITVRVVVQDINDCAPTFTEDDYRFSILENLPSGSSVAAVSATDCDVGTNAELRYSITAGSLGVFQLNCKLAHHISFCMSSGLHSCYYYA